MPKLPDGKGQLNITGIRKDVAEAFRDLCEKEGRKQGKQFERIFEEWLRDRRSGRKK